MAGIALIDHLQGYKKITLHNNLWRKSFVAYFFYVTLF